MWLLLPRSRGRAPLRRLAAAPASLGAALLALSGCGAEAPRERPRPSAPSSPSIAAPAPIKGPAGGLAIGLTETNPYLLSPAGQPVPAAFSSARSELDALAPEYLRVDVDWAALQPTARTAPLLDGPVSGCARALGPCAPYAGLDAELGAIAARQRQAAQAGRAGPAVLVVFYKAPAWATEPTRGCTSARAADGTWPLTPAGLDAYRRLVLDIVALEQREGARLRWWSPWDEPNEPLMLSPQRASCTVSAPSLAPARYTTLARTLTEALRGAPGGPRELVLGELADIPAPQPEATGIAEFVAALPTDLLCASRVWAQHVYPGGHGSLFGASSDPRDVALLERALDARGPCGQRARVWVSETGVGDLHDPSAQASRRSLLGLCRLLGGALLTWYRDPRVDVAFQYTFRQDPLFPVGLISPQLSQIYPSYYLLRAWATRGSPSAPPPPLPRQCLG